MSDEEITVSKLRAFVSKACKNVGLYLTKIGSPRSSPFGSDSSEP